MNKLVILFTIAIAIATITSCGESSSNSEEHSVARQWNEVLLKAIRNDYARPTVHARNLFHISSAMYDGWALFDAQAKPYLIGNKLNDFTCPLEISELALNKLDVEEVISFSAFRLIEHRFYYSPGFETIKNDSKSLMEKLGFDANNTSVRYQKSGSAELGNYIAQCFIDYGLQDGSNEALSYSNLYYESVNPVIEPEKPGNPNIVDINRWQAIALSEYIDQAGNLVKEQPPFLSPEWGAVKPFALKDTDAQVYEREGFEYKVYFDPGAPPLLGTETEDFYQWNFSMVATWSSHLDPFDGVMIDISPNSIGNIDKYPKATDEYDQFYDYLEGGDASGGYSINPVTQRAYDEQWVPRGDYARVLAEFWADGPDSETPPGHWFVILNEVMDHEESHRRFEGEGASISALEWDVKAYFILGGAMHDSAISAWGIKGFYDYLRPVSAIRYMSDRGQSSDPELPNYDEHGIPLVPDYIELVEYGDVLAGVDNGNVGKIKIRAWRGPDYIEEPGVDQAGVGWILAENWWPYQRPTFVSPPFAGYISGHSTYSSAAAEVLTALTGSPFFPGGMSGFDITANEFLVFEEGPSVDMTLQWATYRDAADQCSLSRIWGGIHPPIDDIPGREIGKKIGVQAFLKAKEYFVEI